MIKKVKTFDKKNRKIDNGKRGRMILVFISLNLLNGSLSVDALFLAQD